MSFYIKKLIDLENFEPWSGAIDYYNALMNSEPYVINEVTDYLEEWAYSENITETQLNDFLWFELDDFLADLGYTLTTRDGWDCYALEDEDEDEDE